MTKNQVVPEGILLLAKDGMRTTEQHHFDDGQTCFCSICIEKNKFVPDLILLSN
jgi:hypothetical protein